MLFSLIVTLILFSVSCLSAPNVPPCNGTDETCILQSTNTVWQQLVDGDPSIGLEGLDPSQYELIEGNLSIIKYKFFDTTITGMRQCKITNAKANLEASTLHLQFDCPKILLTGRYDVNGRLIILPVEGQGTYNLITGAYKIIMDSEVKKVVGKDNKTHVQIKNYKLTGEALGPIKFDFKNLFNGQKHLSDAVHTFAHQSWKEVADLVQDPLWYAVFKKIVTNANTYLKNVFLEDMILN